MKNASLTPHQKILMVLGAGTLLSLYHLYPGILAGLGGRASVTLFAGSRLLRGELLYRDIWYDGMPGAVMCNAAALWARRAEMSVLAAEIIFVVAAALIVYRILRSAGRGKDSGLTAAGMLVFCATGYMALGGLNGEGEWSLPLLAGFLFFLREAEVRKSPSHAFAAGVCAGAVVMFLPSRVFLLLLSAGFLKRRALPLLAGFCVIPAMFAVFLAVCGCTEQFITAAVDYRRLLISANLFETGYIGGGQALAKLVLVSLPLLVMLYRPKENRPADEFEEPAFHRLLRAWIWVEFAGVVFLGGNAGAPSFIPVIVPMTVMAGLYINLGVKYYSQEKWSRIYTAAAIVGLLALAAHVAVLFPDEKKPLTKLDSHNAEVIKNVVNSSSAPGDRVLLWSGSAAILFVVDRPSASQHSIIRPLFTAGYSGEAVPEFIDRINKEKPLMVIVEASLLPAGIEEYMEGFHPADTSGPASRALMEFMHSLMRNDYTTVTVYDGIIVSIRKP